ncbi:hypothetical protein [Thiomicrorhabdus sp.]|uniref:hypothetical protein n=1 Tax=Thiomicrorhabdus sp. TaxID=2039724 RepID=UPI002AA94710|nr:hypothetical protein [Thiomicrorhabdus sp.]
MSDIMDDLLEEVEQLEQSTQELESASEQSANQKQQIDKANNKASADANLLALETSKTAQEAAKQSHLAAKTAIKQAEILKEQTLELSESNFNWRQAVRNANKEIESIKGNFTIMLITSITFSLIALGAIGYLMYAIQKQEAQFKGDVLDMVSTENTLLDKKVTLKMDELASVIEILTQKVSQSTATHGKTAVSIHKIENSEDHSDVIDTKNESEKTVPTDKEKSNATALQTHDKTDDKTNDKTHTKELTALAKANLPTEEHTNLVTLSQEEYKELKALIEKLLAAQNALQTQTHHTTSSGLNKDDAKKLNDISWIVRQQTKTLKEIEAKIGLKDNKISHSNNDTILNELKNLQLQQSALQKQIVEMQSSVKKLANQPKEPQPYSYKAK